MRSPAVLLLGGFALAAVAIAAIDYLYYSQHAGDKCLTWHFEPTKATSKGNATQPRIAWVCDRWASQQERDATGQISNLQSANAKVRLEFQVSPDEFSELRNVLTRFAEMEGFSITDLGARMPPKDGRPLFWLRLVREESMEVEITNIRKADQMFVWFYETKSTSGFCMVASKLEQVLREGWMDIRPYEGL